MPRFRRLLPLLTVATMVLAACGEAAQEWSNETVPPSIPETVPTTAVTAPAREVDPDAAPVTERDCVGARDAVRQADATLESPLGPDSQIDQNAAFFDRAVSTAREEIRTEFATIGAALTQFTDALASTGADPSDPSSYADPAVLTALQAATSSMTGAAYAEATANISFWIRQNCAAEE